MWVPTGNAVPPIATDATPFESVALPSVVPPLRMVTVPVAEDGETVTCADQSVPKVTVGQVADDVVAVGGAAVMVRRKRAPWSGVGGIAGVVHGQCVGADRQRIGRRSGRTPARWSAVPVPNDVAPSRTST